MLLTFVRKFARGYFRVWRCCGHKNRNEFIGRNWTLNIPKESVKKKKKKRRRRKEITIHPKLYPVSKYRHNIMKEPSTFQKMSTQFPTACVPPLSTHQYASKALSRYSGIGIRITCWGKVLGMRGSPPPLRGRKTHWRTWLKRSSPESAHTGPDFGKGSICCQHLKCITQAMLAKDPEGV